MRIGQRRPLTASQQYINLQNNPLTGEGTGFLHAGALLWWFDATPSPLSRIYTLRIEYRQGDKPQVFVERPNLKLLAGGRRIPHLYEQHPARLCLYLPRTYEWQSWMRIDNTIVPWAVLWFFYFEEWLSSDEWKGGGEHPIPADPSGKKRKRVRPLAPEVAA
jgi:hypothetical protein